MKATQSSIIRLLEDIPSSFRMRQIPKNTTGVVVEVYIYPEEGYAVDMFMLDGEDENVVLRPDQFEILEAHNVDIGGLSSSLSPESDEVQRR